MIKTVIFDIGKVLIQFDWMAYMHAIFTDEEVIAKVTKSIWNSGWWPELDLGVMPEEEVFAHILEESEALGIRKEAEYALSRFGECMGKQEYAIPWIQELKEMGMKVLYLSNYSDYLVRSHPQILDFIPYMDGGVFSHKVKLIKPNHAIFQKICETYDLNPGECLFTDDIQPNIDAARSFGMKAVRFDGYEQTYSYIMDYLKNGGEGDICDLPVSQADDGIDWTSWSKKEQ